LPAVSSAARKAGVNPSRLLMPLAFATILGCMATLLTTTNIVVSSLLRDRGLAGYGLLDFAPLGLPIVATGVAYIALWADIACLRSQRPSACTPSVRPKATCLATFRCSPKSR